MQASELLVTADSAVEKRQSVVPVQSESGGLISWKNSDPSNAAAVYA